MARKRKYPQEPGFNNTEVPYDYWAFKRWCVNNQGLSESTADAYISHIRKAFSTLFDDEDPIFINLRNAFLTRNIKTPELRIARLEDNYETFMAYIETLDECGDITLDSYNSNLPFGIEKEAPKKLWVKSCQTYAKYIRWRIDVERRSYGMKVPPAADDPSYFLELPLANQFKQYLRNQGKGYEANSIYTYYSKLKRLYNLLLRSILKRDIFNLLEFYLYRKVDLTPIFDKLLERIDYELEYVTVEELSDDDVQRGKTAFLLYLDFTKDFSKNPEKYPKETYEIPWPEDTDD